VPSPAIERAIRMLRRQYLDAVEQLALSIEAELVDKIEAGDTNLHEWLTDQVWETVDGCGIVIYTARAREAAVLSENRDAGIDNFGTEGMVSDESIQWSRLAYGAVEQDLMDALGGLGIDPMEPQEYRRAGARTTTRDRGEDAQWQRTLDGQYVRHIARIAERVVEELRENIRSPDYGAAYNARDQLTEDLEQLTVEEAGDSEWTGEELAPIVQLVSNKGEAVLEGTGDQAAELAFEGGAMNWRTLAVFAVKADIQDEVLRLVDLDALATEAETAAGATE